MRRPSCRILRLSRRRLQDRRRQLGSGLAAALRGRHAGCRRHGGTAVRSQTFYLDITPPGHDKGTFVEAMARRLGIATMRRHHRRHGERPADVCQSGRSFRDGQRGDEIKRHATHVTDTNEDEGFAKAVEMILAG
jgi:hydroxymethylpyrimidine pyrophosphatase-like HAD family hydrolase